MDLRERLAALRKDKGLHSTPSPNASAFLRILGERLPGLDELDQEGLRALMHVLDALVAKNRVAAALKSRFS